MRLQAVVIRSISARTITLLLFTWTIYQHATNSLACSTVIFQQHSDNQQFIKEGQKASDSNNLIPCPQILHSHMQTLFIEITPADRLCTSNDMLCGIKGNDTRCRNSCSSLEQREYIDRKCSVFFLQRVLKYN